MASKKSSLVDIIVPHEHKKEVAGGGRNIETTYEGGYFHLYIEGGPKGL